MSGLPIHSSVKVGKQQTYLQMLDQYFTAICVVFKWVCSIYLQFSMHRGSPCAVQIVLSHNYFLCLRCETQENTINNSKIERRQRGLYGSVKCDIGETIQSSLTHLISLRSISTERDSKELSPLAHEWISIKPPSSHQKISFVV